MMERLPKPSMERLDHLWDVWQQKARWSKYSNVFGTIILCLVLGAPFIGLDLEAVLKHWLFYVIYIPVAIFMLVLTVVEKRAHDVYLEEDRKYGNEARRVRDVNEFIDAVNEGERKKLEAERLSGNAENIEGD